MSRYSEYDGYEGEPEEILAMGRWEHNARTALKGKRGRKALAGLREALMALPEHKLIEGAMCTVGAAERKAALLAEAERSKAFLDEHYAGRYSPAALDTSYADELARRVERDGEGVCAVAAYVWWRKVKAGADPAEAFASLPDLPDEGSDGLHETADLARDQAGMTFTLAWQLAYRNDETFGSMTPQERHAAFIAWIDRELASAA
jgi:hypothetical protein